MSASLWRCTVKDRKGLKRVKENVDNCKMMRREGLLQSSEKSRKCFVMDGGLEGVRKWVAGGTSNQKGVNERADIEKLAVFKDM